VSINGPDSGVRWAGGATTLVRRALWIFLLMCGAWAQPLFRGVGPLGSWVSNGYWEMRVSRVDTIDSFARYDKLSWGQPLPEAHRQFVQKKVFESNQWVLLVHLEARNPSRGPKQLGRATPNFRLRSTHAQQASCSSYNEGISMDCLRGGMPEKVTLPPGGSARGTLVYYLPRPSQATALFFTALRHSQDGESESLVLQLSPTLKTGAAPAVPARIPEPKGKVRSGKGPLGAWVSNGAWQMRISGMATVNTFEEYAALPWTVRFEEGDKAKHLNYMRSHVFGDGKHVVLVRVQALNVSDQKLAFGQDSPTWQLGTNQPRPLGVGLHHQGVAMWNLTGGMPQKTLVNAKGRAEGILVFFVPTDCSPKGLYFTTLVHSPHGPSESLFLDL